VVVWTIVVVVWTTVGVVLTGVVAVVVAVALVEVLDVEVWVWVVRALSGGTGTIAPRRVTETVEEVAESLDASEPVVVCGELDLTAVPTPKPIASAATTAPPSSHHRRRTDAERAAFTSP
jgi:hypothetical protein